MVREVGLIEAMTAAIGALDNEIGGLVQTRLTAPVPVGAATFPVETTHLWPDAGKVSVDGVVYRYANKTLTTLDGITHRAGGAEVAGARVVHRQQSTVLDISRTRSAIDRARRAMLVQYAEGEDLNALGRNLGVFRLPFLSSDDQFREIIKHLAYNPRGTMFGLELALTGMVGAGNFEIYEDLISHPCTVFIRLVGAAATDDRSRGKTYLPGREYQPATGDTGLTLAAPPVTRGAVQSVRFKDEDHVTDARTALPSADLISEYPGEPPKPVWTFVGADESAQVTVVSADSGAVEFTQTAPGTYEHLLRIQPESRAVLELVATVRAGGTIGSDPRQACLVLHDTERALGAGIVDAGGGLYKVTFFDLDTGAPIGSGSASLVHDGSYHSLAIAKNRRDDVQLLVDGVVADSVAHGAFASSPEHEAELGGKVAVGSSLGFRVRQVAFFARTLTDYWNGRGTLGSVASANPRRLDVNVPGFFVAGDAGKRLDVHGSTAVNAQGGNNNGAWLVETVDSDEAVTLVGAPETGATVQAAFPTRVVVPATGRQLRFPDDLGKTIVIEGSALGNDGAYVIDRLLEPGTLVDLASYATLLPSVTNVCEVIGASFVAEAGLDWHLEPAFVTEAGLEWELAEAGSRAGSALTFRQPLPITTPGYTRVLEVVYSQVLSGQVLLDANVENRVTLESPSLQFAYYPFYIADPLGFARTYLDGVTAAGVIPDFLIV